MNAWMRNRIGKWHAELQGIDQHLVDCRRDAIGSGRTDGHRRVVAARHGRRHVRRQALAGLARIDVAPVELDLAEAVVQPQSRAVRHFARAVARRRRDGAADTGIVDG